MELFHPSHLLHPFIFLLLPLWFENHKRHVLLIPLSSAPTTSPPLPAASPNKNSDKALFYGIDNHLRNATSPPPFSGIDASIVVSVRPASEGLSSAFTATENGSTWIAIGGQLPSYDWNLIHSVSVRSHLDEINSICRVWPESAAAGTESVSVAVKELFWF
ncbi:hypothetical protein MtrunA17_Chr8g0365261 [Medicago truncatula]|uniref:Uncharacterized protein n=1 Tax=Medicago truncatula TaxID=3880 RepID=A0A396GK34_MEDTR|nr:hypothetical protein MtrunA17_Chr8g0365261 [Medicago truncatula]